MNQAMSTQGHAEHVSVIVSTYNSPIQLAKVLLSYQLQTCQGFELVIADDGSATETAELIERFAKTSGINVQHVWHADDGFRKCEILNHAIEKAHGDYLLFTDGDCIASRDFVETHVREAEPNRFLSGSYNNLPASFGPLISTESIQTGQAFQLRWLRKQGLSWSRKCLRLIRQPAFVEIMNRMTTTRPTWNGCNASGWNRDIVAANGFDERMKYGGEDRELGLRLHNAGVRGKQIRFKAICLHVDHSRAYVNDSDLNVNTKIRRETIDSGTTYTPYGIRKNDSDQVIRSSDRKVA